ncbi:MAG: GWxTD domain-containing protein [Ignavibacteriales bacterium]|nr:GWxTD domain-containing protein [Ignavibacteriales bacterium]
MISVLRNTFLLTLLLVARLSGQSQEPAQDQFPRDRNVFFEAVPIFGEDTSKAYVAFHYRINKNFFVFIKKSGNSPQEEYAARGELIVELLNAQGVSVGREIRTINLTRSTLPDPAEPPSDIQGAMLFTVPDGTLSIVFEVDDKESGRSFVEKKQTVATRRPVLKPLETSIPFLVSLVHYGNTSTEFEAVNRGLEVVYGTKCGYLLQIYVPAQQKDLTIHWTLEGRRDERFQEKQELNGGDFTLFPGIPKLKTGETRIVYETALSTDGWKIVYVPLPVEGLETGFYLVEFTLALGELKTTLKRSFRVYWPNKPFSLAAFEIAVDALRLIAKEEEVDEMYGFTSYRGYQKFRDFWRKRDPDTTTAYNEVMAEYYRRVDEALRRYSSPKENDGYKTDRGRIFVLYGSPTTTERTLPPNSTPTETWTYQSLRRRFIFHDPVRNGNYVLRQTESF